MTKNIKEGRETLPSYEELDMENIEARNNLVLNNMYLVHREANRYSDVFNDTEELISVGTEALIMSADDYDIDCGLSFRTYALNNINSAINNFVRRNNYQINCLSLDQPADQSNNARLKDSLYKLEDDFTLNCERQEDYEYIRKVIKGLDEKQREIIELYFGFKDDPINSSKIAKHFGISVTRVNQIKKKALSKIRKKIVRYERQNH